MLAKIDQVLPPFVVVLSLFLSLGGVIFSTPFQGVPKYFSTHFLSSYPVSTHVKNYNFHKPKMLTRDFHAPVLPLAELSSSKLDLNAYPATISITHRRRIFSHFISHSLNSLSHLYRRIHISPRRENTQ